MSCKYFGRTILTALSLLFVISSLSISDARECTIKIIQDGREIIPRIISKISTYKLRADEFKIEVNDLSCDPGIFPIKDSRDIEYLQQTPLIFSSGGFGLAENRDTIDVFGPYGGKDPSATVEKVIETATRDDEWAKRKYKELCSELKYCPTPAHPYSRHLPFTDPVTQKARRYAEFKRWIPASPMIAAAGLKCQLVLYTTVDSITYPGDKIALFDLINPTVIIFDFQSDSYTSFLREAKKGDAKGQYNLGLMYEKGWGILQDYKEAAKWYRLAAEQKYAMAQFKLGTLYNNGQGVLKDYEESVRWLKMAAGQGNADAQMSLVDMYANGQGVLKDYKESVRWLKMAADQGNAAAQVDLGMMYANGLLGLLQDYKEAAKWYKMAADQGHALAQFSLGLLYEDGLWILKTIKRPSGGSRWR